MRSLFVLSALFGLTLSQVSMAGKDRYFSCSNVGGVDEHTIYVDLVKNKAGFFDNDSTAVVPMVGKIEIDIALNQVIYIFEGVDTSSDGSERLRINFNRATLSGSVTLGIKKPGGEGRVLVSEEKCKAERYIELD